MLIRTPITQVEDYSHNYLKVLSKGVNLYALQAEEFRQAIKLLLYRFDWFTILISSLSCHSTIGYRSRGYEKRFEKFAGDFRAGAMNQRASMSVQDKEQLFQFELVKACVPYEQAVKVAHILASELDDEQLADEDVQLVKRVCLQWLEQRKRWELISQAVYR